jgi:hypothetical protein
VHLEAWIRTSACAPGVGYSVSLSTVCVCACLLLTLDETVALHNVMTRRRVSDQRMASHPVRGSREEMFLSVKYVPGV